MPIRWNKLSWNTSSSVRAPLLSYCISDCDWNNTGMGLFWSIFSALRRNFAPCTRKSRAYRKWMASSLCTEKPKMEIGYQPRLVGLLDASCSCAFAVVSGACHSICAVRDQTTLMITTDLIYHFTSSHIAFPPVRVRRRRCSFLGNYPLRHPL